MSDLSPAEIQSILNGPALRPPPGVVPNFDHPPNANHIGVYTNAICLVVAATVLVLRAYAKVFCVKRVYTEDYMIVVAFGLFICSIYCSAWAMRVCGLFVHQWDVRVRDLSSVLYIVHIGANLCAATFLVLKTCVLLEFIRIFVPRGVRTCFFWTTSTLLTIHVLFHTSWIVVENLSCQPYQKIWDPTIIGGSCINIKALFVSSAVMNLITNVLIFILPQKAIWSLHMSTKSKFGISLVFMIGLLGCLSSAFRLRQTIIFYESGDVLYTESGLYLWNLAEMTCLFLVFCVPAIPKIFADVSLEQVLALLPWHRNVGSEPLESRRSSKPPTSGQIYQQPRRNGGNGFVSSNESIWGPVTEITAETRESQEDPLQGINSILCITEVKTEVTPAEKVAEK